LSVVDMKDIHQDASKALNHVDKEAEDVHFLHRMAVILFYLPCPGTLLWEA